MYTDSQISALRPIQILVDPDREPGRLRDLEYESEEETEEEKVVHNSSSARWGATIPSDASHIAVSKVPSSAVCVRGTGWRMKKGGIGQ